MTKFVEVYNEYSSSNHNTRECLWVLCRVAYIESQSATVRQLSDSIGKPDQEDTVRNWALVGELIAKCEGEAIEIQLGEFIDLFTMWDNGDALSYDHLLRVAKLARRHELDPQEILERLYNAMNGQTAESLERDIEETHVGQAVLLQRDLKRIGKRLKQNFDSLEFRGVSHRLVLAYRILERRMEQELKRLEAE